MKSVARPAKLSRESIVEGALTFLDREGWDSLTINALATQLGTKGRRCTTTWTASRIYAGRCGFG